jgi:site-specific DNA recombinase
MKPSRRLHCAIYTRVSTEHGLEQEFNSLDAQREAAEAYIKSQAHEGWLCLKDRFDDGGYSGGSMERPALQELLNAVKARRIDVIVVYKVDRLTRSLADFAKLVELFDAHGVSFVSVTQSFNTTSSMGRLTLNVLLSFAQFEREVTGERIRDKIAASKKKGLWMGGIVPYGYRLENRKLLVDPPEAELVRQVFILYLELKSLPQLAQALADRGIASRPRTFASGEPVGGKPFRTGALSHLLGNRMYLGEINHRNKSYPGEHEPIIAPDLFEAVQTLLSQRKTHKREAMGKSQALLGGLIFDDAGNRMTPVHASKGAIRYRYYQSWVLGHGQKNKAGSIARVPAGEVERAIIGALEKWFPEQNEAIPNIEIQSQRVRAIIRKVTINPQHIAVELNAPMPVTAAAADDASDISRPASEVPPESSVSHQDHPEIITIAWAKPTTRRNRQVLAVSGTQQSILPLKSETRARIVTGIAQARLWLDQLTIGKVPDLAALARSHDRSEKSVRSLLSLAFLAPDIVEAAVSNRLPRGLGITNLTGLPADWTGQRQQLGLA